MVLKEVQKNEKKMFIFSNTLDLLLKLEYKDANEILPLLQIIETTSQHLPKRLFETDYLDDHPTILLLREALSQLMDFKNTQKIFYFVFGPTLAHDSFNPECAMALIKIYSQILMICKSA